MAEVKCSELAALLERLAEAINHTKRLQSEGGFAPEDQLQADATLQDALEAVRSHKAAHQCEEAGDAIPAA